MARKRKVTVFQRSWEEWLNDFTFYKQAQGRSETTIGDYRFHVNLFFTRYKDAWNDYPSLKQAVYQHLAEVSDKAAATFNIRREYLHGFFSWLIQEGMLTENPITMIPKKKDNGRVRCVDEATLKKLLSMPDRKTFAGLRDYALIVLTLDTGIRPKEAFSLKPDDMNLNAFEINIKPATDKTRVGRTLPITISTANIIMKFLSCRPKEWKENIPVFCTHEGGAMDRRTWAYRMNIYSKKLGYKITPYDLRHSFALMYLRGGGNAFSLQRTLGHTSLAMTKRYVAITDSDLRKQHAVASPIQQLVPQTKRIRSIK